MSPPKNPGIPTVSTMLAGADKEQECQEVVPHEVLIENQVGY